MPQTNILQVDWETIEHRRQLARLRHDRERERRALLIKVMKAGHRAAQLRMWLDDKTDLGRSDPMIGRMLEWARQQLAELEAAADPVGLARLLRERELFPEFDQLSDPLGEPPARQPWGR